MTPQNIAFRVDASSQIGTGHFMRCLTLAGELKQRGVQVRFVSRDLPVHLHDMLAKKGIELASMPAGGGTAGKFANDLVHAHWLPATQKQDAQTTIHALAGQSWDWLVVDHYALDARWENDLRAAAKKIMVIDDLADRQHDCDLLLDQNYYVDMQTRYAGKVPAHCQLLLGPGHALLRDEFGKLRERANPRTGSVKKVLVFFGGVDEDNYTGFAIETLTGLRIRGLQVDVVIGAQHPCRSAIEDACATQGYICHVQTQRMAELMVEADLSIGSGGSATLERCAMGLPSIIMVVAENQKNAAEDLDAFGVLVNLGDARLLSKAGLGNAICRVISDAELRFALSLASLNLVPMSKQGEVADMLVGNHV